MLIFGQSCPISGLLVKIAQFVAFWSKLADLCVVAGVDVSLSAELSVDVVAAEQGPRRSGSRRRCDEARPQSYGLMTQRFMDT